MHLKIMCILKLYHKMLKMLIRSRSLIVLLKSFISLSVLVSLFINSETQVLAFPLLTGGLSVPVFLLVSFCFINFEAQLLGTNKYLTLVSFYDFLPSSSLCHYEILVKVLFILCVFCFTQQVFVIIFTSYRFHPLTCNPSVFEFHSQIAGSSFKKLF